MSKIKDFLSEHHDKIILSIGGILIAAASFGIGRLTVMQKSEPVVIDDPAEDSKTEGSDISSGETTSNKQVDNSNQGKEYGKFVASLQGNVYYASTSSKAKAINEDEKVWFETKEEAEEQGYEPYSSDSKEDIESSTKNTSSSKASDEESSSTTSSSGKYVASKNGSKYYLPSCSGAKRIKEENKVWFNTTSEAEAEGLEPAKNCAGLE